MFDFPEEDEPDLPKGMGCELCGPDSNCPPCMCQHCQDRRSGALNSAIKTAIALSQYDDCAAAELLRRTRP